MTETASSYSGRQITFATMHGKEQLAHTAFGDILAASVTAAPDIDTDQLGTFAGEIERPQSPLATARAKARMGMKLAGTHLGLASEGSFSSGLISIVEYMEVLIFIDDERGLELVEGSLGTSPIPGARRVQSTTQALDYAAEIGYPEQGVVAQCTSGSTMTVHKNLIRREQLEAVVEESIASGTSVVLLPDYRAHKSPSRAQTIATLCTQMAQRLATPCPECDTPGFGRVDVVQGVPCSLCSNPTPVIGADILGCGQCEHRSRVSRTIASADPRWCDSCNP